MPIYADCCGWVISIITGRFEVISDIQDKNRHGNSVLGSNCRREQGLIPAKREYDESGDNQAIQHLLGGNHAGQSHRA